MKMNNRSIASDLSLKSEEEKLTTLKAEKDEKMRKLRRTLSYINHDEKVICSRKFQILFHHREHTHTLH